MLFTCFARKVFQVCEGGLLRRTMDLLTLVSPMSIPSFKGSPRIRGAPHIGVSRLMIPISSPDSPGPIARPGLPCRTFQVQKRRKPLRCQAITVAALTMKTLVRHSLQTDERQTHRIRSVVDSFGLFTDRCRTPS